MTYKTLFSFATATITEFIEHKRLEDVHLKRILPFVLNGLKSEEQEYNSGALMILTQIASKVPLTKDLINLNEIFSFFRKKLLNENWKNEIDSINSISKIILYIKHPNLSGDVFHQILPIVLKFTDDYMIENKIIGVNLLLHLLDECNTTEIRWNEVILFDVMLKSLAFHDSQFIEKALPCMVKLLKILVPKEEILHSEKYEKVLVEFLSMADYSSETKQRMVIFPFIENFILIR